MATVYKALPAGMAGEAGWEEGPCSLPGGSCLGRCVRAELGRKEGEGKVPNGCGGWGGERKEKRRLEAERGREGREGRKERVEREWRGSGRGKERRGGGKGGREGVQKKVFHTSKGLR